MGNMTKGITISNCNYCRHIRPNIGFKMNCDAFPDGIPYDFDDNKVKEGKECNNGIKYEEKESRENSTTWHEDFIHEISFANALEEARIKNEDNNA